MKSPYLNNPNAGSPELVADMAGEYGDIIECYVSGRYSQVFMGLELDTERLFCIGHNTLIQKYCCNVSIPFSFKTLESNGPFWLVWKDDGGNTCKVCIHFEGN